MTKASPILSRAMRRLRMRVAPRRWLIAIPRRGDRPRPPSAYSPVEAAKGNGRTAPGGVIRPERVISTEVQARIEEGVRTCAGRSQWSKIVVMSRFQTEEGSGKKPKWFWPVWEGPRRARLPGSPA